MSVPTLVLGDFDLTDWSGSTYGASVIAEGTSRGGPVSIDVAVQSWLQDGSIVITQGYNNREVSVRVRMRAPDLLALAEAEAALFSELGKPNLLTWTPPDGYGPPSVFVVVTSSMVEAPGPDGDIAEASYFPWRTYNLSLTCEAFVRSATEVVAEAEEPGNQAAPPTPISATITSGSPATGWVGFWSAPGSGVGSTATTVTSNGSVLTTVAPETVYQGDGQIGYNEMKVSGLSVNVTGMRQLSIEWTPYFFNGGSGSTQSLAVRTDQFFAFVNDINLPRIAGPDSSPSGQANTTFFQIPAGVTTVTSVRVVQRTSRPGEALNSTRRGFDVDSIGATNASDINGTPRQLLRILPVAGSARTQGRVTIEHQTSSLGDVMAYFYPDDGSAYSPAMRAKRAGGGSVANDSSLVSGAREDIVSAAFVARPTAAQIPPGRYLIVARMGGGSGLANIDWSATTLSGGNDIGPVMVGSRSVSLTSGYQIFPIGRVELPTRRMTSASAAFVNFAIRATGTSTCLLDELWLFNMSIGRLVGPIGCGTGTPAAGSSANRLWINPATVDEPSPTVLLGFSPDGSDMRYPADLMRGWQFPEFKPPSMRVLTVTTNALGAAVRLRHFPRWHSNAAA